MYYLNKVMLQELELELAVDPVPIPLLAHHYPLHLSKVLTYNQQFPQRGTAVLKGTRGYIISEDHTVLNKLNWIEIETMKSSLQ